MQAASATPIKEKTPIAERAPPVDAVAASSEFVLTIANDVVMKEPVLESISADKKGPSEAKKAEPPKKNPAFSLTKFFKPMQPEEKEKMLLNELAKVQ